MEDEEEAKVETKTKRKENKQTKEPTKKTDGQSKTPSTEINHRHLWQYRRQQQQQKMTRKRRKKKPVKPDIRRINPKKNTR